MSKFLGLQYAAPAEISRQVDEAVSGTWGARVNAIRRGSTYWRVQMSFEPKRYADASGRLAAHRAKHGTVGTFDFTMPQPFGGTVAAATGRLVSTSASAGADTITLKASTTVPLVVGRFISFTGHNKVYMVDGDADYSIVSGGVAVKIVPNLVKAVNANVNWNPNPNLRCRYAPGSGGDWSVGGRQIVLPIVTVIEDD